MSWHTGQKISYCDISAVLLYEEDHFCIWTGTTVGKGNMYYFKWFLVAVGIQVGFLMLYVMSAAFIHF